MDPWSTYWWYNQQQHGAPPGQPAQQPVYFAPPAPGAGGGGYDPHGPPPWTWHGQQQQQHQVIPGTHHLTDNFYSRKFPDLHPTLAIDTSAVAYDVRKPPHDGVLHAIINAVGNSPALKKQVTHIRLISKDFPWQLDIKLDPKHSHAQPITVANIWESLYNGLLVPVADSEWGCLAIYDKHRADAALRAAARRGRKKDEPMLRVDWLGEGTLFKGLDRDTEYIKRRLLPTEAPCEDTWMVRMG